MLCVISDRYPFLVRLLLIGSLISLLVVIGCDDDLCPAGVGTCGDSCCKTEPEKDDAGNQLDDGASCEQVPDLSGCTEVPDQEISTNLDGSEGKLAAQNDSARFSMNPKADPRKEGPNPFLKNPINEKYGVCVKSCGYYSCTNADKENRNTETGHCCGGKDGDTGKTRCCPPDLKCEPYTKKYRCINGEGADGSVLVEVQKYKCVSPVPTGLGGGMF